MIVVLLDSNVLISALIGSANSATVVLVDVARGIGAAVVIANLITGSAVRQQRRGLEVERVSAASVESIACDASR